MLFFKKNNSKPQAPTVKINHENKQFDGWLLPPNQVEAFATEEQLKAGIKKISVVWTQLGIEDAHYSVLTAPEYRTENLSKNIKYFWQSGKIEAAVAIDIFKRYQPDSDLKKLICVEYGCGVGRVTFGLADYFAQTYGYDVSDTHLQHAEKTLAERKLNHISFHHRANSFMQPIEKCDLFYSKIVFQHNPPPIILCLIKQALTALNLEGIAMFQVPVYKTNYQFKINDWLAEKSKNEMEMHCLPQYYIFQAIAEHGCIPLEIWEDNSTGAPERFISASFVVKKVKV